MQRPSFVAFVVGSLLTGYFFFAISRFSGFLDARTPHGRILGLLGFAAIVGSLMSRLWEHQPTPRKGWKDWHNVLGLLSVWLILLHSHLRFGNVVATLAFSLLLITTISGAGVTWIERSSSPSMPSRTGGARPVPVAQLDVRRERLVLFHIAVMVGMITLSLFHILAILYY